MASQSARLNAQADDLGEDILAIFAQIDQGTGQVNGGGEENPELGLEAINKLLHNLGQNYVQHKDLVSLNPNEGSHHEGRYSSILPIYSVSLLPLSRTPHYIPSLFDPYRISCLLFRIPGADVLRLGASENDKTRTLNLTKEATSKIRAAAENIETGKFLCKDADFQKYIINHVVHLAIYYYEAANAAEGETAEKWVDIAEWLDEHAE